MRITRSLRVAALAALLAGCGGARSGPADAPSVAAPIGPLPLDRVWRLESTGVPPEDTTVAFPAANGRVILVRRGPPDNTLFATVRVPPGSISSLRADDSVRVRVLPRPGLYGIDLEVYGTVRAPLELTFGYAVHFTSPAGAREQYGSDLAFERALRIGVVDDRGRVTLLPSRRPGSDLLTAAVSGGGRYIVGAPR